MATVVATADKEGFEFHDDRAFGDGVLSLSRPFGSARSAAITLLALRIGPSAVRPVFSTNATPNQLAPHVERSFWR
jgi:hypothetical protein